MTHSATVAASSGSEDSGEPEEAGGQHDGEDGGGDADGEPGRLVPDGVAAPLEERSPRHREGHGLAAAQELVVDVRAGPDVECGRDGDEPGDVRPGEPGPGRTTVPGGPPRHEEADGDDGVGDLGGPRERDDGPRPGRAQRPRPPARDGHRGDDERGRHHVDVRAEDADAEDERVEGPQDVDPAVRVLGQHPAQQEPDGQPRRDDEQLPDPDALAEVVATEQRRQPVQQRAERSVDARLLGPRGLDAAGDRIGAAAPVDRPLRPGVTAGDEDAAVREVAEVVARAERAREEGEDAESRGDGPRPQGGDTLAQPEEDPDAADEVGDPQGRRDGRRRQRHREQDTRGPAAGGEVGLRGVGGHEADEDEQAHRQGQEDDPGAVQRPAPARGGRARQLRCHGRQPRRTRASHTSRYCSARWT